MRLATITNWAYAATVVLTIASSATMLLASNATDRERAAVEQRYRLDQATATLEEDVFLLSDRARQYVNTGDPTYLVGYRSEEAALKSVEERISHIGDAGASTGEIEALADAVRLADLLHDEQRAAVAAHEGGDEAKARQLLFGAEYERQLDRAELEIKRFRDRLDARVQSQVNSATEVARLWKGISEITLALTALLVLCVLYFVFKQRVLRPVVKLSDVVNRLAAQDFAAEPPAFDQVDEIGDMAQAIRIFRENGLERQRLESERDADRAMRDLLSRMTQRLQGCDTMDDLKDVVQRFVPEITPGLAGRLYLLDRQRNMVVEACGWQNPGHSRAEFSALACWALRRGLPHRPAGDNVDVPCDHVDRSDAAAPIDTLCLPLTAQRETLGLLYFEAPAGNPGALSGPEIYLDMLAENIGLAIANLLYAYSFAYDNYEADAWFKLFTSDAVFVAGVAGEDAYSFTGEGFRTFWSERMKEFSTSGNQRRHLMTNILFLDQTGDTAHVSVTGLLTNAKDGKTFTAVSSLNYEGWLVKGSDGWKIQRWHDFPDSPVPEK
ncbi:nuclear transport factor 2 family protein [uncultured Sphingopyxis sp.]|uniref:nuclear transport factor 2 family protein n=1 Tax=uncultured Sphingopyxis sp. TaxID=310581 RepID=UPI0025994420|nr:nuclear transport factor 2 family protein [uncultured Sphingopyxis sp.]